jgi:hypothetical protein
MPDTARPLSDEHLTQIRAYLEGCKGADIVDVPADLQRYERWLMDSDGRALLLLAEVDRLRAVVTSLADTVAAWTGDDTPEEDRPGYDGPTIDPADRLLFLLSPEVPGEARVQLIAEHRQMVTGEIAGMLRSLTAAAVVPVSAAPDGGEQ